MVSSFGVGLAYDQARARTLDGADNGEQVVTAGDGDVDVRGLQVYVFGRHRNRTRLTAYASPGMAVLVSLLRIARLVGPWTAFRGG